MNIIFPDTVCQNSELSIVDNSGRYDFMNYSRHEAETIGAVFRNVLRKYDPCHYAIGLVNESQAIVYKARYILFEIVILRFSNSTAPLEQFAVAFAYSEKGASYRLKAIEYFEKSLPQLKENDFSCYGSFLPLAIYNKLSLLYEKEHLWDKAIYYLKLAKKHCDMQLPYYKSHLAELVQMQKTNKPIRRKQLSQKDAQMNREIEFAAQIFLNKSGI